jgi:putative ABC transport system permease protein
VLARLEASPGVRAAALSSRMPMTRGNMVTTIMPEGHPRNEDFVAELIVVSPGFFRTLDIPLIAGRDLSLQDVDGSGEVVVISESLARRYWPGQDPLGKRIMNFGEKGGLVVGVAGDIRTSALRRLPMDAVYVSMGQMYRGNMGIVAQVQEGTPPNILTRIIAQLDATLPVHNERALAANLADSLGKERIVAVLLTAFGILALILATAGVYSLASMAAQLRTREFGIRVALGATRADILRLVMRQTALLVLVGLLVGIGVSLYAVRALQAMLFEVGAADPLTLGAVASLLLAAGLAAGYLPGRRATRVDPMIALRYE